MKKLQQVLYQYVALILLIVCAPLFLLLYILVKTTSKGPFIFKQKRVGKNKKRFMIYKIRTMVEDAENLKSKIQNLNEADGPVFKIHNDPRYTKVGKYISHTGLDELPQFINIIKGEMSFVGPRPLPVSEAKKVPKKYERRFSVIPGITSQWVVTGSHTLTFDQWMKGDLEYIKKKSLWYDVRVAVQTIFLILKSITMSFRT